MFSSSKHLSTSSDLPFVFLHGWGMNSGIWKPFFADCKTDSNNMVAIDLPGYGKYQQTQDQSADIETVAAFIDSKIDRPCIIAGWSLGGLVATKLALAQPQKYRKLITVCSSPCFVNKHDWKGIDNSILETFATQLQSNHIQLLRRFVSIQTMGLADQLEQNKLIMKHLSSFPSPTKKVLEEGLVILKTTDLRRPLSEMTIPHLAIFGRLDSLVPQAAIQEIAVLNPQTQQITIDHAAHAPFLSHPQQFIQAISQFLQASGKI